MNSDGSPFPDVVSGIDPLWDAVVRDQRELTAIGPVLRHLVLGEDSALLGEEPVTRTRGLVESLAIDLLRAGAEAVLPGELMALNAALVGAPGVLDHVHALAIEGQMVSRLAERGFDPLLPPLVQDRISSPDPQLAALAMNLMAAQTRFVRRQQRMEMTAAELPADLFHEALRAASAIAGPGGMAGADRLRADYDERRGRLGILAQLGLGLGDDFPAALDPARAGFSLFATAVSLLTGQPRDSVVLAAAQPRPLRLALLLAIAGLEPAAREAVILQLQPDAALPRAWLEIQAVQAADLLAQGQRG